MRSQGASRSENHDGKQQDMTTHEQNAKSDRQTRPEPAHNSHKSKTNDTPRPPRVRPRGQERERKKRSIWYYVVQFSPHRGIWKGGKAGYLFYSGPYQAWLFIQVASWPGAWPGCLFIYSPPSTPQASRRRRRAGRWVLNSQNLPNPEFPRIPHLAGSLEFPAGGRARRLGAWVWALVREVRKKLFLPPRERRPVSAGPRRGEVRLLRRSCSEVPLPSAIVWWPLEIPGVGSVLLAQSLNSGGVSSRPSSSCLSS